jgi:polyisoprenoid-binding protein YceI
MIDKFFRWYRARQRRMDFEALFPALQSTAIAGPLVAECILRHIHSDPAWRRPIEIQTDEWMQLAMYGIGRIEVTKFKPTDGFTGVATGEEAPDA